MRTRALKRAIAFGAVLTLVLAACGGDDDDSASESNHDDDCVVRAVASGDEIKPTLDEECQKAKDEGVTAPEGFKVSLVTDVGRIDDGTFNQYSYDAMVKRRASASASTPATSRRRPRPTTRRTSRRRSPTSPNVLITNGLPASPTDTLAAANGEPRRRSSSASTSSRPNGYPTNYIGVLFREDQGGYLAGVMAASLSKSGVIGVVGGREDVPPVVRYVNAYKTGAESVNPDIRVLLDLQRVLHGPEQGRLGRAAVHG